MAVGIDIVDMSRIRNTERLANFILSVEELEIYKQKPNKVEFLSGRFAAKEAFLKAMHTGIGVISFKKISIVYDETSGAPILHFDGKTYDVSISHDGRYAVAMVDIR
jgi:holo-[acyl-carrier protein] synthase